MDINHEGREIILQHDIETVLITTKLSPMREELNHLGTGLRKVKQNLVSDVQNAMVKNQRAINKALLDSIRASENSLKYLTRELDSIAATRSTKGKSKRAFEILGSFLSTVTGVPSARDHRKILEQVRSIRLENKGLERLMAQNAHNSKDILDKMHLHQTEIATLAINANKLANNTAQLVSHLHKAFALISINSKLMNSVMAVTFGINAANSIIAKGDEGLLSRHAISTDELAGIIDKIHMKRKADSPVFSRETCFKYYELKLAHSWVNQHNFEILTLLQIPIASLSENQHLHVLDANNTISVDLPMAVLNLQANSYRFLTLSDYLHCIELGNSKLCQKRLIEINPQLGCSLRLRNCGKWTTDVVHDLSNTEILISLEEERNATISCDKTAETKILLPRQAIIQLALHCKMTTSTFIVHKISFRQLRQVEKTTELQFNILDDKIILKKDFVSIQKIKIDKGTKDIEQMQQENKQFQDDLAGLVKDSEANWNAAQGGRTAWEQIISWSLIALCILLIGLLASWTVRLQIQVWKNKNGGGRSKLENINTEIGALKSRLMDLETDLQISTPFTRPPAYAVPTKE